MARGEIDLRVIKVIVNGEKESLCLSLFPRFPLFFSSPPLLLLHVAGVPRRLNKLKIHRGEQGSASVWKPLPGATAYQRYSMLMKPVFPSNF